MSIEIEDLADGDYLLAVNSVAGYPTRVYLTAASSSSQIFLELDARAVVDAIAKKTGIVAIDDRSIEHKVNLGHFTGDTINAFYYGRSPKVATEDVETEVEVEVDEDAEEVETWVLNSHDLKHLAGLAEMLQGVQNDGDSELYIPDEGVLLAIGDGIPVVLNVDEYDNVGLEVAAA